MDEFLKGMIPVSSDTEEVPFPLVLDEDAQDGFVDHDDDGAAADDDIFEEDTLWDNSSSNEEEDVHSDSVVNVYSDAQMAQDLLYQLQGTVNLHRRAAAIEQADAHRRRAIFPPERPVHESFTDLSAIKKFEQEQRNKLVRFREFTESEINPRPPTQAELFAEAKRVTGIERVTIKH